MDPRYGAATSDDVGTVELPRPEVAPAPARKVHHLNCATLCPVASALINDRRELVCHCVLVETEQGLVLVDTGLGTEAVQFPPKHTPKHTSAFFQAVIGPKNVVSETALHQIEALGFRPDDVRHIVLTHLDSDHAGGLPDFPNATVHVFEDELNAAMARKTRGERERYVPS